MQYQVLIEDSKSSEEYLLVLLDLSEETGVKFKRFRKQSKKLIRDLYFRPNSKIGYARIFYCSSGAHAMANSESLGQIISSASNSKSYR